MCVNPHLCWREGSIYRWYARATMSNKMVDVVSCMTLFISDNLLVRLDILVPCSWNRWKYSWRRSMKTSRKFCVRRGRWSPNCWFLRTRYCLWSLSVRLWVWFSVDHFIWLEIKCFWDLRSPLSFEGGHTVVCNCNEYKRVIGYSGEPEGCGDGEEAEERLEENQSPPRWCSDYVGPPEE